MNSRVLYIATLSLALASSLALADETRPLTREQVIADYNEAAAAGTLRKNDYDFDAHDVVQGPTRTRADVVAEMAAARRNNTLVGPLRNRTYNPYGAELLKRSTLARATVRADVLTALRDGSLRHTEYDDVTPRAARTDVRPLTQPVLARATNR